MTKSNDKLEQNSSSKKIFAYAHRDQCRNERVSCLGKQTRRKIEEAENLKRSESKQRTGYVKRGDGKRGVVRS